MKIQEKSKLSRFSDEDVNEIMDLYYNSDFTVTEVLELFNITGIRASELYRHFPPIISDSLQCRYCGLSLVCNRKSKTSRTWGRDIYHCPECGHTNETLILP